MKKKFLAFAGLFLPYVVSEASDVPGFTNWMLTLCDTKTAPILLFSCLVLGVNFAVLYKKIKKILEEEVQRQSKELEQ
jgi:hypothetical protein